MFREFECNGRLQTRFMPEPRRCKWWSVLCPNAVSSTCERDASMYHVIENIGPIGGV